MTRLGRRVAVWLTVGASLLSGSGCEHMGVATEGVQRSASAGPVEIAIQPCIDRTGTAGRDLGAEATRAFDDKLRASGEFTVKEGARYRLACEVTSFLEGSAIQRWIWPGWGPTVGQVSAMLTDGATGEIVVIVRANARVAAGGLYTIGADTYIVPTAVDDAVQQLRAWTRGHPPGAGIGAATERR